MGEMADWMIDRMIFGRSEVHRKATFQTGSGNYMWRTADGTAIHMREMTTEHLVNAIEVAKRKNNHGKLIQLKEVLNERYGKNSNR